MLQFLSKINDNYGLELNLFNWLQIDSGILFFEFVLSWNKIESDNMPTFECSLYILNLNIIDFIIFKVK